MFKEISVIIALGALIALAEMPNLLKEKQSKDLFVFLLLLGVGIVMNAAIIMDLNIPSPLNWIMSVYEPFSKAILSILS